MVELNELNMEAGNLYMEFIKGILTNLGQRGIEAGYTSIATPKDSSGFPTLACIIARRRKGWKGKLPFNFKYNLSKEGILMRMYGHLRAETESSEVIEAVDELAPDYIDALQNLGDNSNRRLSRRGFVLERGINLKEGRGLEMAFG